MHEELIKNLNSNRSDFGKLSIDREFIEDLRVSSELRNTILTYIDSLDIRDLPVLHKYTSENYQVEIANTIKILISKTNFEVPSEYKDIKVAICYITTSVNKKFSKRELMLKESLLSLNKLTHTNFEIHILVNGISQMQEHTLTSSRINYHPIQTNKGLAYGRNKLIEEVLKGNSDYLLFLDDDTYINDPKMLTKLIHVAVNEKQLGMIGPEIVYKKKKILELGLDFILDPIKNKHSYLTYSEVDFIEGSCTLFDCMLLKKLLNTYNEIYPVHYNYYWEEVLLAWKLWYIDNSRNIVVKGARIVHIRDGGGFTNPHSYYFFVRNFIYLANDIYNLKKKRGVRIIMRESFKYLTRQYRIAKDKKAIKYKLIYLSAVTRGFFYILKNVLFKKIF